MVQSMWRLVYSLIVCLGVGVSINILHVEAQPVSPTEVVNDFLTAIRGNVPGEPGLPSLEQPKFDRDVKDSPSTGAAKSHLEALEIIDISRLSQGLMGKHWSTLSLDEQSEFTTLFGDLLLSVAFPQSAIFLNDLDMLVVDERIQGAQAIVATTLQHPEEGTITIDYQLEELDGQWRVQDVEMDGVSLTRNLRSQVNRMMTHASYAELLLRMREKLTSE